MTFRTLTYCLVLSASLLACATAQSQQPIGQAPDYTHRSLTELPNGAAISQRIWTPELNEGYVPQGVAIVAGKLYVSAYRSESAEQSKGPCRLYRVSTIDGAVRGKLDLPASCGHAGGLAKGPTGKLYVADSHEVYEVALQEDAAHIGRVLRSIKLGGSLKGSFAAGSPDTLWLGSYERGSPGRLYAFRYDNLKDRLSEADATATLPLPSEAQGAAFDSTGRLWISRSGSRFGELLLLNGATGSVEARYRMPSGLEDLSFSEGALWTLSEAGSKRWLGWSGFHPLIMKIDPSKLR